MTDLKLGVVESHFADIVWDNAPLSTKALVECCQKALNWKRTTTYTVLKKLCDRGIFSMQDSTVTVLISREEYHTIQSQQFVQENFSGSLPAFIAAFTARQTLTPAELKQVKALLDSLGGEKDGTVHS